MACPLCGRDRRELADWCSSCTFYVVEALGVDGSFSTPIRYGTTRISPIVRYLAPRCYLCGEAPTEHADHVVSKALGGTDTWDNLGGACAACNGTKGDRALVFSDEQAARLAEQQAAIRAVLDGLLREPDPFWLAFLDDQIDLAVDELASDWLDQPEYVDLDDAILALSVDSLRQHYPLIPRSASDIAHQEVLARFRRLAAYDPES
ncbi:MAG: HNH endonuclease [Acidimicrobiia bacterium]